MSGGRFEFGKMVRVVAAVLLLKGALIASAASMVDPTFKVGTGANWYVEHMLEQPDGKILFCGLFSKYNDQPVPFIGRLNPDGSIDTSFRAQPAYWVRHMILLPDGKIVIGGMFTVVEGEYRRLIARLNPDGTLDRSFDPGRGGEVSIGTSIYGDPNPFIIWMDIQPDGKIVAIGNFHDYDGAASPGIVRINPDGSRDASFNVGSGLNTWGRFVRVLPNSQIIASGWFSSYNNRNFNRLVRINSDGSFDPTLNAFYGDKTSVYSVYQQPDGKLITSGHSLNDQKLFSREIVRLNEDGSVDESWVGKTNGKTESIVPQPDGKVILVGSFTGVDGVWKPGIARLNADGTLDPTLHAECNGGIWNATPTRDKKLLVCGEFISIDGVEMNFLGRLILPEYVEPPPPPPPLDPPGIAAARITGQKFQCVFQSVSNVVYTLQFKETMDAGEWNSLPDADGNDDELTLEDDNASSARFYRVQARRRL
jgi:uncharacterized delta-60 repeat protein